MLNILRYKTKNIYFSCKMMIYGYDDYYYYYTKNLEYYIWYWCIDEKKMFFFSIKKEIENHDCF